MLLDDKSKIIGLLSSGTPTPGSQPTYVVTGGVSADNLTDDLIDYISATTYVINNQQFVYGGGSGVPCPLGLTNGKCWLDASGLGLGMVAPLNGIVIATFDTNSSRITRWTPTATFAVNEVVNRLVENDVRLLHTDGDIAILGGKLTWTDEIRIELPTASAGTATHNKIPAGDFTLSAGEIAYATLDRLFNSSLIVKTAILPSANLGADDLLLGYYDGSTLYLPELGTNTIAGRLANLENKELIYEIFESIGSNTAGTLAPPAESTILLDRYPDAGDCIVVKVGSDGRPIDDPARDSSQAVVLGTLDASGSWTLSATPSSYPVALVYQVSISLKFIGNIPQAIICNIYSITNASEVAYDNSTSGLAAKIAQSAIDELAQREHADTAGLTDGDAGHTQFALLAGRDGGQEIVGSSDGVGALGLKAHRSDKAGLALNAWSSEPGHSQLDLSPEGVDQDISLSLRPKGDGAIGLGSTTLPSGENSISLFGHSASGDKSVSFNGGKAEGDMTFSAASGGEPYAYGSAVFGVWPTVDSSGNKKSFVATDRIFAIGIGTANNARKDAVSVNKSGDMEIERHIVTGGAIVSDGQSIMLRDTAPGTYEIVSFVVDGKNRWHVAKSNTAETGNNAGSDFSINRFNDDGSFLASGLYMSRATGDIALAKNVKCGNSGSGVFVANDGSYGITKTISFMDYGGDIHHFTFKGGILTGHHLT